MRLPVPIHRTMVAVLVAVVTSGCNHTTYPIGPSASGPMPAPATAASTPRIYLFQPGDSFDVKLPYTPEFNESVLVRPDGKASLQLAGEVQVAGLTPAELEQELRARYGKVLRAPAVTVAVKQVGPQRVFVAGEVRSPGEVPWQGDLTALQAIARSGFFTHDAETRNVVVLRYKGDAGPQFIVLDFKSVINGEATPQSDIALQPLDVVFVPQTQIASVAEFFGRYVGNIIPLWRNLNFSMVYYTNAAQLVVPK